MKRYFTTSFKIQAVEKALSRGENITLVEMAESLGVGYSTLNRWIIKARNQEFDSVSSVEINNMSKDKRPSDWTLEERLKLIVSCGSLTGEELNEYCREKGGYPHHLEQWKRDFINGSTPKAKTAMPTEVKTLKHKNKALKRELNRKDKALAEAAALLVLQKKLHILWDGNEEES